MSILRISAFFAKVLILRFNALIIEKLLRCLTIGNIVKYKKNYTKCICRFFKERNYGVTYNFIFILHISSKIFIYEIRKNNQYNFENTTI